MAHSQVTNQFAQTISIEGRVFHNNEPVNEVVDLVFEVYVEGFATCTLYRETHENINVADAEVASQGYFSEQLGAGTSVQLWTSSSLTQVFANNVTLMGESSCTVTSTQLAGRNRMVRVSVKKDAEIVYSILDEGIAITTVPTAMVAETLQGRYATDFFTNTGGTTDQAQLYNLLGLNFTTLSNLVGGTSTQYIQTNAGGAVMPTYAADPGSAAGQMWFNSTDNAIKFRDGGGVVRTMGVAGAGIETISGTSGITATTLGTATTLSANVDNATIGVMGGNLQVIDNGVSNIKISDMSVAKLTSGAGAYFTYTPSGTECANGEVLKWNSTSDRWLCDTDATGGVLTHSALTGLTSDDHAQYAHISGRVGGQTLTGGTAASDDLVLHSTSHTTKGDIVLQPSIGNVGIQQSNPQFPLDVGVSMTDINIGVHVMGGVRANNSGPGIVMPLNMRNSHGANGAGTAINFEGVNTSSVLRSYGRISAYSTDNTAGSERGSLDLQAAVGTNLNTVMTLVGEGRVGIGTTLPSTYKLEIVSGDNNQQSGSMQVKNTNTGALSAAMYMAHTHDSAGYVGVFPSNYSPVPTYADRMVLAAHSSSEGVTIVGSGTGSDIRMLTGGTFPSNERLRITNDGRIGIGTTSPQVSLDLGLKTDALRLPVGTTGERPSSPAAGMIRYNTTNSVFEGHNGGGWSSIANPTNIDHDALLNFDANKHVDHSTVMINAGSGLTGGGNITASRTLAVDIASLTNIGAAPAAADQLMIYDASDTSLRKISYSDLSTWAITDVSTITSALVSSRFTYSPQGTACNLAEVLKWNGTYWACSTDNEGAATFGDGSVSAPSMTFTSDTDTGLYRPSSNEVAFASGGSERMRIDPDGKMGIGTTAPRMNLDVAGGIKIGNEAVTCDATREGAVRVNGGAMEFCTANTWYNVMPKRGRNGVIFKTAGTHNFPIPDFVTSVKVTLIGGGGGYNTGCSIGGGHAGAIYGYIDVLPGQTLTIIVGAGGGVAGGPLTPGPAGGDSILTHGTQTLTANGGPGELGPTCAAAGVSSSSATGVTNYNRISTIQTHIDFGAGGNDAGNLAQPGYAEVEW